MKRFLILPAILFIGVIALGFSLVSTVRPDHYFTKGNELSFKLTAENGATSYSEVKITDVIQRGAVTEIDATDQRLDDQRKTTFTYRLTWYSDSLNWCASALNHLSIPLVYSSNFIVSLRSDSLVYPYTMKVGDTLLPSSASELIITGARNERFVMVQHRKVIAIENITTAGETLQAFRIQSIMTKGSVTDYGALGKIPSETTYEFTEWFVPSKGVVKSELKSKTGVTSTLLESLK